ncbi:GTP hydrolase involved in nickel liganding into hydrogenases (plasmid) [Cupriavidus taiwanensis]|uniref:Hydrogenase maturation factor HypB n=1 Tax=Cupriavidus taiwanensis TaxID=164546 RepID=A0A375EBX5_9BURK|nr:hydrogenase nickel incorporation protein HypB [Cupriavidus taiwanensis]SOZ71264.1 GTP hydrolase involved in nickel liganding into hydrogenases [Cupriavidus taiwanensis]SOZ72319.1 GTP hydrolase involved in nickel liganding into hydrogenases [Cupriavidus taiwanensis]SOZ74610.1 GTP hydrolase involved in nickel liganding into hydrogenases [Cupriavidus taiwanensis]SPA03527.1 GTP hydrolase involved in nickel liganding into hydrogenases [Cupriavidus taiwanensis]SPA11425.1 GTP hydrolase involved in
MCVVCGCGSTGDRQNAAQGHEGAQAHGHSGSHSHAHPGASGASGEDLHYGLGPAGVTVPGLDQGRTIKLEQDVLDENNRHAAANRQHFMAHGVRALNLVSSPGSGKTTLLCASIAALRERMPGLSVGVIEGDQQTASDAERIRASGAPAIQVNTGKGCHLDAAMVTAAFGRLPLHEHEHAPVAPKAPNAPRSVLFIENVGNLVCPALWDLGEEAKVAILSVTEGEDKPLKYPDMFAAARLMIVNKIDLLPYVQFDVEQCIVYARRVNPSLEVIRLSATTGEGLEAWLDWIARARDPIAERIGVLESELAALRAQQRRAGGTA